MDDDRNHFKFLNKTTAKVSSLLERIRIASSAFYIALQIIFFLLLAIATVFIEQACEKGWTVILLLAIFGILFLLSIFAFDYANAKRINHQFFWKPWILILILILNIMYLGLRIGGQRIENAEQLQETNDFYGELTRNLKDAILATNLFYTDKIGKLSESISDLKGQLYDAKQDRDKYQVMLAPFEAMAIAKYTNAPLNERLDLMLQNMGIITNELVADRPVLHLEINGVKIEGYESPKIGEILKSFPIFLNTNRQIALRVFNDSEITAEQINLNFSASTDVTNILASQWVKEPPNKLGNNWHLVADDSFGALGYWYPQTIEISKSFNNPYLDVLFMLHANRSKTMAYAIRFFVQN